MTEIISEQDQRRLFVFAAELRPLIMRRMGAPWNDIIMKLPHSDAEGDPQIEVWASCDGTSYLPEGQVLIAEVGLERVLSAASPGVLAKNVMADFTPPGDWR